MAATDVPQLDQDDLDDDLPDAVKQAEAAVAALAENYTVWVRDDLTKARKALEEARETAPDNAKAVRDIFDVCHNVKGQGGTFGYDLMTMIGASLCDFTRDCESADADKLKIVEVHLSALDFVVDRKFKGDGGEAGRELLAKLEAYVANAS